MAYTKQTVAAGQTITSDWGNTIQTQYDEAMAELEPRVDNLSYDLYELWMELYYKGTIGQADAQNTKGLIFDGFKDNTNINASSTTATVSVNNSATGGEVNQGPIIPTKISKISGTQAGGSPAAGYIRGEKFTALANMTIYGIVLKLGSAASARLYKEDGTLVATANVRQTASDDGNYTEYYFDGPVNLVSGQTYRMAVDTVGGQGEITGLAIPYTSGNIRYEGFCYISGTGVFPSNLGGSTHWGAEIITSANYPVKDLYTIAETLGFTVSGAKLYYTAKTVNGIVPKLSVDGGTTYVTGQLVSTRNDEKTAGYTEYEYNFNLAGSGPAVLDIQFTAGSDISVKSTVKRYGLLLY